MLLMMIHPHDEDHADDADDDDDVYDDDCCKCRVGHNGASEVQLI